MNFKNMINEKLKNVPVSKEELIHIKNAPKNFKEICEELKKMKEEYEKTKDKETFEKIIVLEKFINAVKKLKIKDVQKYSKEYTERFSKK